MCVCVMGDGTGELHTRAVRTDISNDSNSVNYYCCCTNSSGDGERCVMFLLIFGHLQVNRTLV